MKRLPAIVGAVAIGAIAILVIVMHRRAPPAPPTAPPSVPTARVRRGEIDETIALAGRIGPAAGTQTKLSFAENGLLSRVAVGLGEHVRAGETLAQLDERPFAAAAQQASASAQAANAQAANARVDRWSVKLRVDEAELARQRTLLAAGVVAQSAVQAQEAMVASDRAGAQSARDQIAAAQAQALSAAAQAASADYNLRRARLTAPSDGVVVGVYAQPGQELAAATPVIAIAPDAQGVATLDVPVVDVTSISRGDLVRVSAAGRRFDGRIGGVAPAVDPATGLAMLAVVGIPSAIPPGTPVDATVVYGKVHGLIVPQTSLVTDPGSGKTLAFVAVTGKDGAQRFVPRVVQVGASDGGYVIVSGLRAGERVAVAGAIDLLAAPGSSGG